MLNASFIGHFNTRSLIKAKTSIRAKSYFQKFYMKTYIKQLFNFLCEINRVDSKKNYV